MRGRETQIRGTEVSGKEEKEDGGKGKGWRQRGAGCGNPGGRLKVNVVEGQGELVSRQYHHGRCDVGSPWACGTAFDVLDDSI